TFLSLMRSLMSRKSVCEPTIIWSAIKHNGHALHESYFIFLRSCFGWTGCVSQQTLLSYGCLFAGAILVLVRVLLFMQLLRAHRNFGYGLADSAFVGLVNETTRLLSRNQRRRTDLLKNTKI
ncbi:unnamed protein product, partial [Medioppia subpectinata]